MDDPIDLLQVKIEKAKMELPEETRQAIDAVDWKAAILSLREKKGYDFEQLGDLELETELLLCGLLNANDYPKELENRMKIPKAEADKLVNEMNDLVFKKIREEMIKITERREVAKSVATQKINTEINPATPIRISPQTQEADNDILKSAGIEITNGNILARNAFSIADVGGEPKTNVIPIKKLMESFKLPTVKTEYTLNNLTKTSELPSGLTEPEIPKAPAPQIPKAEAPKITPMPDIVAPAPLNPTPLPKVMTDIRPASKNPSPAPAPASYPGNRDPYRLSPDE